MLQVKHVYVTFLLNELLFFLEHRCFVSFFVKLTSGNVGTSYIFKIFFKNFLNVF